MAENDEVERAEGRRTADEEAAGMDRCARGRRHTREIIARQNYERSYYRRMADDGMDRVRERRRRE